MTVELNHMIVAAHDAETTARWWAEVLGLDEPIHWGPFWQISTANGVNVDFDIEEDLEAVQPRHYAFLLTENEFDEVFGRIVDRGVDHYADPAGHRKGEINHNDGGRGTYFPDPNGHWLEIITRPYGSGD